MTEETGNIDVDVNTDSFLDVPEDTEDLSNVQIGEVEQNSDALSKEEPKTKDDVVQVGVNIGVVTRFFNRKGFGFIKQLTNNKDYFVHNSSICVQNNEYRKLFPGEYVSFDLETQEDSREKCVNVRGVQGGPLLVENKEYSFRYYDKRLMDDDNSSDSD